jgi:hypothetical protein
VLVQHLLEIIPGRPGKRREFCGFRNRSVRRQISERAIVSPSTVF